MRHLSRAVAALLVVGVVAAAAVLTTTPHAPAGVAPAAAAPASAVSSGAGSAVTSTAVRRPPNIVLITTDDMRLDDLRVMPFTREVLARRGVTFTDAISPYPLCCPARAEIVTGQYSHNNGVRGNGWPNGGYWALTRPGNTLPVWLRERGYRTGFIGKYMNEYGNLPANAPALAGRDADEVPPGWTHWYASVRDVYAYDRVTLNVDTPATRPHRVRVDAYQTDYFAGLTEQLIDTYHRSRRPFFLWVSHLAPHTRPDGDGGWAPPLPPARHRGLLDGVSLPRDRVYRAALNEDTSDKLGPMRGLPKQSLGKVRWQHQRRLESLKSVDQAVRRTVRQLQRTDEFRRTVIMFTSDNGFDLAEHRHVGKDLPYEPVLRIPMIISAPGLKHRYRPGATASTLVRSPHTVTTVDIPATVVAASGAEASRVLDGLDMLRPAANPDHRGGDRAVLIESGSTAPRRTENSKFVGVRTDRWTWFGWNARPVDGRLRFGGRELYDRDRAPAQVTNMHGFPRHRAIRTRLHDLTQRMRGCRGRGCVRGLE